MSVDQYWDVNKYREEHESEDQWRLRRAFLVQWKDHYPEERLVCLARVFTNMEFMGCRYPKEVMREVAKLSVEVAKNYREGRKNKLKRTFVSASDAAGDRARGVKREGGVVVETLKKKHAKIAFVPESQSDTAYDIYLPNEEDKIYADRLLQRIIKTEPPVNNGIGLNSQILVDDTQMNNQTSIDDTQVNNQLSINDTQENKQSSIDDIPANNQSSIDDTQEINQLPIDDTQENLSIDHTYDNSSEDQTQQNNPSLIDYDETNGRAYFNGINYISDITKTGLLDVNHFKESMFKTEFGKFVLVIRPWNDMICNLISSCAACRINMTNDYKDNHYTITMGNLAVVSVRGDKTVARNKAGRQAWELLRRKAVILLLKEQWVAADRSRITVGDMGSKKNVFGEPIESSVALKMMKLMGWKGGGLGADCQGIEEPIKPALRMVRRAGLGHGYTNGVTQLKRAGLALMRQRGIALDGDLVFAADFSSEERAVLHRCANMCGLHSKSYGKGDDRFLVVTNKMLPFELVRGVLERGGETAKYRVFIPATLANA